MRRLVVTGALTFGFGIFLAACADGDDRSSRPRDGSVGDGAIRDASPTDSSRPRPDGGMLTDSGRELDSGAETDSGADLDSGRDETDGGGELDGGDEADGGDETDGAAELDGGEDGDGGDTEDGGDGEGGVELDGGDVDGDVPTDGGLTDAASVDAGDTTCAPNGTCTAMDCDGILASGAVAAAENCGLSCFTSADSATCGSMCVATRIAPVTLTTTCLDCFGAVTKCGLDHCVAACAASSTSPGCTACLCGANTASVNCIAELESCSGVVDGRCAP